MTSATTAPDEVREYLGAVRAALADLPADERDDLLLEVEASIAETAAEADAPVAARLGPPEEFAAELRAAAGLHAPETARLERGKLRELMRRIARHRAIRRIASLGHDLAPIWWVARGYAAVGVLAVWLETDWAERYPFVPRFNGSASLGLALLFAGIVVSVVAGLFARRRHMRSAVAAVANIALVVALGAVLVEVDNATLRRPPAVFAAPAAPIAGLAYNGDPVANVYPYARNGRLLHDVLLYDETGSPLEVSGNPKVDPDRRFVHARGGETLLNAFPIRYFQPGTHKVADPDAGPRVDVPVVVTRPLPEGERTRRR
jgi:hypothetical protein